MKNNNNTQKLKLIKCQKNLDKIENEIKKLLKDGIKQSKKQIKQKQKIKIKNKN